MTKSKAKQEGRQHEARRFVLDQSNGYLIVRDETAQHEFNQDGITLATIDYELTASIDYGDHDKVLQAVHDEFIRDEKEQHSQRETFEQKHGKIDAINEILPSGKSRNIPLAKQPTEPLALRRAKSFPVDSHLIQTGDEARAQFLAEQPLALLQSVDHQDAVCRWLFASGYLPKGELRDNALKLLDSSKLSRRRAYKHHNFKELQLKQAYKDLKTYCSNWYGCIHSCRSSDEVKQWFPDCLKLQDIIPRIYVFPKNTSGGRTMSFDDVLQKNTVKPNASEVAEQYIKAVFQLPKTTLHDIID